MPMISNTMLVKGTVVDLSDPNSESRVKVRIPCYHGISGEEGSISDENLPWAQQCLQRSNMVDVGNTVWITFEGGDVRFPIILGQLGSTAVFADDFGTSGSGSLGIVGGEYDITIDGVTYHVGGSTLAEMGLSLITINEGGSYSAYNGWDVNGISIGLLGFHLCNAFRVLKKA